MLIWGLQNIKDAIFTGTQRNNTEDKIFLINKVVYSQQQNCTVINRITFFMLIYNSTSSYPPRTVKIYQTQTARVYVCR